MVSLADETNLDPAFDDSKSYHNGEEGGAMQISYEEELEGKLTPEASPRVNERRKRNERGLGRARRDMYDSDEEGGQHSSETAQGDFYSLADELGSSSSNQTPRITFLNQNHSNGINPVDDTEVESDQDQCAKDRKNQEHYLVSSEILGDSLRHTHRFLTELQIAYTGVAINKSQSLPPAGSNVSINGLDFNDMGSLEGRAGILLKEVREQTIKREEQIRELQEYDRILRRAFDEGGDWFAALGNVEDLGEQSNGRIDSVDSCIYGAPLSQHINSFQHSTMDLILSLGSIHEQGQIAQASMNDAARRIRTIKNVLGNWSNEVKILEESKESKSLISAWELKSKESIETTQEWTRAQMNKVEWILNDAEVKARQLLSQVKDPVLDALAARGWEVDQRKT